VVKSIHANTVTCKVTWGELKHIFHVGNVPRYPFTQQEIGSLQSMPVMILMLSLERLTPHLLPPKLL